MKIFFLTSLKLCLVATKFNISNIQKVTPDDHHDDDHTDMSETKLKSYHQFVTCYNNEQLSEVLGNKFKTTDYIPDLKTISFDNMISSCNVTGVWLFYDRVNYSGSTTFWAFGYNFSVKIPEFFNNKAISLRDVGAPDDWKASSLNLYSNVNFTNEEEFAYGDIPEIKIKAKSVIVTGCEPWAVYQEKNYQGQFSCIYPSDTKKCTPGLYPTIHKLELVEKISSARRGCQEGSPIKTHLGAIWRHSASGAFGLLCPSCNKSSFQR